MRKHLNNPRIVLPVALLASIWVSYSYGLLDNLVYKLSNISDSGVSEVSNYKKESIEVSPSARIMQGLLRDQWLSRNWTKYSTLKNEPFVATYNFDKSGLPEIATDTVTEVEEVPETVVIIDFEKLESYIAEQLGLDEIGFFVRFENVLNLPVRKRPGDLLHSSDGRVLELGNIAIAETNRSDEEHALAVQKKIAELRLNGSINTNFDDKIIDEDSKKNTGREESAIIDGGIRPSGIYAQGELITKDPVIGLDEAHDSYVILVDSRGSTYELKLDE
ncbi:MAG: hypothetical protein MK120_02600 [Puniceicoccaceae bacterium]|nr:hypothetical protein [Puniceicoccaceae bacterium]MCH2085516.1 hypothetical protein [Saprospiraceae bacterium]